MVQHCANPGCNHQFQQLHRGDLYALETRAADTQFFWICAACSPRLMLIVDPSGAVSVQPRSHGNCQVPPHRARNLRLMSANRPPIPCYRASDPIPTDRIIREAA